MRTTPTLVLCLAAAVVFAAALTLPATFLEGSVSAPPPPAPSAVTTSSLTVAEFTFDMVAVPPGAAVVVTNADSVDHTVTAEHFDVTVAGGATATFTAPTTPGSYPFTCLIHPSMTGVLTVTG